MRPCQLAVATNLGIHSVVFCSSFNWVMRLREVRIFAWCSALVLLPQLDYGQ